VTENAESPAQHSAIIDALQGRNFVIEGPPGTGKSQTIANLIASFLHRGKTVLFVSEKMAALDVVKARLDRVGLGDYCLTLHAAGAKPASVIEALKRRAQQQPPRPMSSGQEATYVAQAWSEIGKHLKALHAPIGPDGETAHTLIGRFTEIEARRPEFRSALRRSQLTLPPEMSSEMVTVARQSLQALDEAARQSEQNGRPPSSSPFRILTRTDLLPDEQEDLIRTLRALSSHAADAASSAGQVASEVGEPHPDTLSKAEELLSRIDGLVDPAAEVDLALATRLTRRSSAEEALRLADVASETNSIGSYLAEVGVSDPAALQPETLTLVAQLVRMLNLNDRTIGDLPTINAEFDRLAGCIHRHTATVARLSEILNLQPTSMAVLVAMCKAAELAAQAEPGWSKYCQHGLQRHALMLTEAAERQQKWRSQVKEHESVLDFINLRV
jgi:hypothetical protein